MSLHLLTGGEELMDCITSRIEGPVRNVRIIKANGLRAGHAIVLHWTLEMNAHLDLDIKSSKKVKSEMSDVLMIYALVQRLMNSTRIEYFILVVSYYDLIVDYGI